MVDRLTFQLTIFLKWWHIIIISGFSALGMILAHDEQKNTNTKRTTRGTNLDTRNRLYYFHWRHFQYMDL